MKALYVLDFSSQEAPSALALLLWSRFHLAQSTPWSRLPPELTVMSPAQILSALACQDIREAVEKRIRKLVLSLTYLKHRK